MKLLLERINEKGKKYVQLEKSKKIFAPALLLTQSILVKLRFITSGLFAPLSSLFSICFHISNNIFGTLARRNVQANDELFTAKCLIPQLWEKKLPCSSDAKNEKQFFDVYWFRCTSSLIDCVKAYVCFIRSFWIKKWEKSKLRTSQHLHVTSYIKANEARKQSKSDWPG